MNGKADPLTFRRNQVLTHLNAKMSAHAARIAESVVIGLRQTTCLADP